MAPKFPYLVAVLAFFTITEQSNKLKELEQILKNLAAQTAPKTRAKEQEYLPQYPIITIPQERRHRYESNPKLENTLSPEFFYQLKNKIIQKQLEDDLEQALRYESDRICQTTGRCGCSGGRCGGPHGIVDRTVDDIEQLLKELNSQLNQHNKNIRGDADRRQKYEDQREKYGDRRQDQDDRKRVRNNRIQKFTNRQYRDEQQRYGDKRQQYDDKSQEEGDRRQTDDDRKRVYNNNQQYRDYDNQKQRQDERRQEYDEIGQRQDDRSQEYDERRQRQGDRSQEYDERRQRQDDRRQRQDNRERKYEDKRQGEYDRNNYNDDEKQRQDQRIQKYDDRRQRPNDKRQEYKDRWQRQDDRRQKYEDRKQRQDYKSQQFDDRRQDYKKNEQEYDDDIDQNFKMRTKDYKNTDIDIVILEVPESNEFQNRADDVQVIDMREQGIRDILKQQQTSYDKNDRKEQRAGGNLNIEDFVKYYEKVKKEITNGLMKYVKNQGDDSYLAQLLPYQKKQIEYLKNIQSKTPLADDKLKVNIVQLLFGTLSNIKLLPHSKDGQTIYIPQRVHNEVNKNNMLRSNKRLFPLTFYQKQRQRNLYPRNIIVNHAWRRSNQQTPKYGVPFDLEVQGLGQIN